MDKIHEKVKIFQEFFYSEAVLLQNVQTGRLAMNQLPLSETIQRVEQMIDSGDGDPGRLYHILESLRNNKTLYHSDQVYLEHKLNAEFSLKEEKRYIPDDLLEKIKFIIDSGNGDPGRLQHIYDMISQNRTLYHSDQKYLELKLEDLQNNHYVTQNNFELKKEIPQPYVQKVKSITEEKITPVITEEKIPETPAGLSDKLRGSMPKDWVPPNDSSTLTGIYEKIKTEEQRLDDQKRIYDEINIQRSKLSQLILNRQEYEKQVKLEQSRLESQIKEEREKIAKQTHFSEELLNQKKELDKVKSERDKIILKISEEKTKIAKELEAQKKQLVQAQLEQEAIEKQVQKEQTLLAEMTRDQKNRLLKQAQIAHEIKQKQEDLEKARSVYDEIVSQVNQEKEKLSDAQKLKDSIKVQENDLLSSKKEREKLLAVISKEKEEITRKMLEEKEKLNSERLLAKQLKKEEKLYEKLKAKREKIDEQIKNKNKKLKEKQQVLKKQIAEKDKKLKSLSKKPLKKNSTASS